MTNAPERAVGQQWRDRSSGALVVLVEEVSNVRSWNFREIVESGDRKPRDGQIRDDNLIESYDFVPEAES